MRSGISSSKIGVIVRPLPPRTARPYGAIAHPEASPHASRGVLVVLDGVAESLGHVVGSLGHVVVLQQREQPGVGGAVAADGGLQAGKRKVSIDTAEPGLHVSDDGAVSDDWELLHLNPPHHRHAGHAGSLAPDWRKVEAIVVELLQGVGRHLPLHQLGELTDVQTTLAQPGKDP